MLLPLFILRIPRSHIIPLAYTARSQSEEHNRCNLPQRKVFDEISHASQIKLDKGNVSYDMENRLAETKRGTFGVCRDVLLLLRIGVHIDFQDEVHSHSR